ncbi:MAG: hypothetical protein ABJ048_15710 [Balneola sp.]
MNRFTEKPITFLLRKKHRTFLQLFALSAHDIFQLPDLYHQKLSICYFDQQQPEPGTQADSVTEVSSFNWCFTFCGEILQQSSEDGSLYLIKS